MHPECPDLEPFDQSVAADVLLRQEPDEEEGLLENPQLAVAHFQPLCGRDPYPAICGFSLRIL
jgi:hypothetical protein